MRAVLTCSIPVLWVASSIPDASMLQVGVDELHSVVRKAPNSDCDWKFVQQTPYRVDDDEAGALLSATLETGGQLSDTWLCNKSDERTVLIGPLRSQVQQWHTMKFDYIWLKSGDRVKSYTGDAVSATDGSTPIAFPPLHMHHIHIETSIPHWQETHGDYVQDPKRGYVMDMPAGTYMKVRQNVKVSAHVNDVRFSDGYGCAGSAPVNKSKLLELRQHNPTYDWYLRIRFGLALPKEKLVEVNKMALLFPLDRNAKADGLLNRFDAGNTKNVMFWEIKMPHGGTVLPSSVRLHAHRARFAGYLLVRGSRSLEGLLGMPKCSDTTCDSIANVRKAVMEAAGDDLLCFDHPEVPSFVQLHGQGGAMGKFDRQGKIECKPFEFKDNEIVTVFSFQDPVWAKEKKPFSDHVILFFNYMPAHEKDQGLHDQPIPYPDAWARWEFGAENVTYWKVGTDCHTDVAFGMTLKNGTRYFPPIKAAKDAARKVEAKVVCEGLSVRGVARDQKECNGMFHATNQMVHGAPVYKSGNRSWYWSSTFGGQWQCDTDTDAMYKNVYVSTASSVPTFPQKHIVSAFWSLENRWKSAHVTIQCVPKANPMWITRGNVCEGA